MKLPWRSATGELPEFYEPVMLCYRITDNADRKFMGWTVGFGYLADVGGMPEAWVVKTEGKGDDIYPMEVCAWQALPEPPMDIESVSILSVEGV